MKTVVRKNQEIIYRHISLFCLYAQSKVNKTK